MRRILPGLEVTVCAVGLGAMPLSLEGRPEAEAATAVLTGFLQAGGDFIDTANVYCRDDHDIGHNERLIREVLAARSRTAPIVVATKGGLRRPRGSWTVDASPAWLRQSCEQSLRDLGVESIQLYQLHAVDPAVDLCVSLDALVRLQNEGKIKHIGLSNVGLQDLQRAVAHTAVVSVQNRCSPYVKKDFHNGVVDLCRDRQLTYIAHSPVGGHFGHARLAQDNCLQALAVKHRVTAYQIALAWLLRKGEHILPIPGASRLGSILDSLRAMEITLDVADVETIDALPDR